MNRTIIGGSDKFIRFLFLYLREIRTFATEKPKIATERVKMRTFLSTIILFAFTLCGMQDHQMGG